MNNPMLKNLAIWVGIFVVALSFAGVVQNGTETKTQEISYSQFLQLVENGAVTHVDIVGNTLSTTAATGEKVPNARP